MSTPASSLNWWYIDGRRRLISSGVNRDAMSTEDPAVGAAAAGLDLRVDRARALIARQQVRGAAGRVVVLEPLVGLLLGFGVLAFEHRRDVVEHEALALGVLQHAAVTAHTLGDQDSFHARRPHHARRGE